MLKKDNFYLGVVMGVVIPVVIYGILLLINMQTAVVREGISYNRFDNSSLQALSIFSNLFPFRYYMIKLKFDKTGKGLLLITFIFVFVYFFLNKDSLFK